MEDFEQIANSFRILETTIRPYEYDLIEFVFIVVEEHLANLLVILQVTRDEDLRTRIIREIRRYLHYYHIWHGWFFTDDRYIMMMGICTNEFLDDSELTIEVIQTVLYMPYVRHRVFNLLPSEQCLAVVLRHAKAMAFDFWGVQRGEGILAGEFNPVADCFNEWNLKSGRFRNPLIFLQYGFQYFFPHPVYTDNYYDLEQRRLDNRELFVRNSRAIFSKVKNSLRMMLVIHTFNALTCSIFQEVEDRLKALNYIYRSIKEPYITPSEMLEVISPLIRVDFTESVISTVNMYRWYRNYAHGIFDQDDCPIQPRSLKHLCRYKIRYVLADKMSLPEGIGRLNLPVYLANYLNLER